MKLPNSIHPRLIHGDKNIMQTWQYMQITMEGSKGNAELML
jgi:hypothetical protein